MKKNKKISFICKNCGCGFSNVSYFKNHILKYFEIMKINNKITFEFDEISKKSKLYKPHNLKYDFLTNNPEFIQKFNLKKPDKNCYEIIIPPSEKQINNKINTEMNKNLNENKRKPVEKNIITNNQKKRKIDKEEDKNFFVFKNFFEPNNKFENNNNKKFVNLKSDDLNVESLKINLTKSEENLLNNSKTVFSKKIPKTEKIEEIKISKNKVPKKNNNNFNITKISPTINIENDDEIKKKIENISFLLNDDILLSTLSKTNKTILIKAAEILKESINDSIYYLSGGKFEYSDNNDNKTQNNNENKTKINNENKTKINNETKSNDNFLNENFGLSWNKFKAIIPAYPLMFILKRLIISSEKLDNINNIPNLKSLYKSCISIFFITNQILNINKKNDSCNLKKIMTFHLKKNNNLSCNGIKILNKIGLTSNSDQIKSCREMISKFNNELLIKNLNYFKKNLLLFNSDNKYYIKNAIINDSENNKNEEDINNEKNVRCIKSTTKILRFPGIDFVEPDLNLKKKCDFGDIIKNKTEAEALVSIFEIKKNELNSFNNLNILMIKEIDKKVSNIYFYKKVNDANIKINNNVFILKSDSCGDDSCDDNYKIVENTLNFLNKKLQLNYDIKNFNPFWEVDQKGFKCMNKLINQEKIKIKLLSGPFHLEINLNKALMQLYYDFPVKQIAKFYGIKNDFSAVTDTYICVVRKIVSIVTFVVFKYLLDYIKNKTKKYVDPSFFYNFFENLKKKNKVNNIDGNDFNIDKNIIDKIEFLYGKKVEELKKMCGNNVKKGKSKTELVCNLLPDNIKNQLITTNSINDESLSKFSSKLLKVLCFINKRIVHKNYEENKK